MSILLTGGAGYIGSHAALTMLNAGYDVVVLDNLSNASRESLIRVEKLTGRTVTFVEGDVRDRENVRRLLVAHRVSAVIHFAGLKAVAESGQKPLAYYENNVGGTITLCQAMSAAGVKTLVFSSSATVYGMSNDMPLQETMPTGEPANPYGRTKLMVEEVLKDLHASDPEWSIALLRYFNPVGAHASGEIGEDPLGIPNNLLPYITQVAVGRLEALSVYGSDYPTPDGTGIRDYIHVMDLAEGHLSALQKLVQTKGLYTWNLGAGRGYSVLEVVGAFERLSGRKIRYDMAPRRAGDVAECWADASKAEKDLGWRCTRGLDTVMRDAWRWQMKNPNGFAGGAGQNSRLVNRPLETV